MGAVTLRSSTASHWIFMIPANSDLNVSSFRSDLRTTPLMRSPFLRVTWSARAAIEKAKKSSSKRDGTHKFYDTARKNRRKKLPVRSFSSMGGAMDIARTCGAGGQTVE